ncbi:EF-hand calcium-binding domain-containing protein 14-like isoform X2 [Limulus polyphemus]|uniref:EF-hand calcium-binding domain-containing protein 14-like isoform X2 n=1 Tax=Limulus polyphemus TaxID=6850 RepID=A0ABM1SDA9_LIMPO|nr:EF-hand calcium-binding domain-containing protein 14-like isoform X2 [Limulus polyphemus]
MSQEFVLQNWNEVKLIKKNTKRSTSINKNTEVSNFLEISDLASDSEESIPDFSVTKRKLRSKNKKGSTLAAFLPFCLIVLVSTSVVTAGTWIWLHLGLRQDLDLLRDHLQTVEAGNKNTPETLHSIHSQLKEFEKNVSILGADLQKVISEISVLGKEVEQLKQTAGSLKESIAAAPEIKELPKDVSSLSENVASFGSKITAMEATIKDMKYQQASLQTSQEGLKQSLTNFQVQIQALSNVTEKLSSSPGEDQTAKLRKEQRIFHDELLRVAEAVDNINISTLPVISKVNEILPLLEKINGSASWSVEDLNSFYSEIMKIKDYMYHNITGQILALKSGEKDLELAKTELKTPNLNTVVIQHMIESSINLAIKDMLNNTLTIGTMSNTNITLTEILKQTQDVVHTYLELIQQLKDPVDNHLLNQYSNATNVVGQLLNLTVSSLLKDHEGELQTLQNNVSHLLTQYSQLKTAQAATEEKINTVIAKLQLVEVLTRDFQNSSEVTNASSKTYSGSLGKGSSEKNKNAKTGIFKRNRFQPPTP